jgi:hypothetical protein
MKRLPSPSTSYIFPYHPFPSFRHTIASVAVWGYMFSLRRLLKVQTLHDMYHRAFSCTKPPFPSFSYSFTFRAPIPPPPLHKFPTFPSNRSSSGGTLCALLQTVTWRDDGPFCFQVYIHLVSRNKKKSRNPSCVLKYIHSWCSCFLLKLPRLYVHRHIHNNLYRIFVRAWEIWGLG